MSKSPMTKVGAEKLREQLHELKTVDRPRITAAIAEAISIHDMITPPKITPIGLVCCGITISVINTG